MRMSPSLPCVCVCYVREDQKSYLKCVTRSGKTVEHLEVYKQVIEPQYGHQ